MKTKHPHWILPNKQEYNGTIQINNTQTNGERVPFYTLEPGKISWYVILKIKEKRKKKYIIN